MDRPSKKYHAAAALLVVAAAIVVFAQTSNDGFISLDDGQYVFNNPHVGSGLTWPNLRWALTDLSIANWQPVTLLSHQIVAAAFGVEPAPHHIGNVTLHAINALLVYAVLFRFTGAFWPSLVATLLFTVHPLRAESVAWVSERKGLLCAFFGLLALLSYERYARAPSIPKYLLVTVAFILGLLSKPALIPLPFSLLLFDHWPLGRFASPSSLRGAGLATMQSRAPEAAIWNEPQFKYAEFPALRLVAEKLPLIAIAIAITVVTFIAQAGTGTVQGTGNYPITVRVANAIVSYGMYLWNTFVPIHLTIHYTHPRDALFRTPALYISVTALVVISVIAIWQIRARPWILVGWLWFLGMLVPVIGLIQLADQARADRYTYLPQIGVLIAVAWALDEVRVRSGRRVVSRAVTGVAAVWILALAVLCHIQTARWKDDLTLFMHAVAQDPASSQAYYGLGVAHLKRGDIVSAEAAFLGSVARHPPVYQAFSNLGAIELRRGNVPKAAGYFGTALELKPEEPDVMVNLGVALYNLGQRQQARQLAESALGVAPDHARARELLEAAQ